MIFVSTAVLFVLAQPAPTEVPPPAMTLAEAKRVALANHPDLASARGQEAIVRARVTQARSGLNPQLDATGTAAVSGTEPPDFFDPSPSLRLAVALGWQLTDFGRTDARVRQIEHGLVSAENGIAMTEQAITAEVERVWFETVARIQLVSIAHASVSAEERHLADAERLVKVGTRPPFDIAQAKSQLALARSRLARAEGDVRLARGKLAQALALPEASYAGALDTGWPTPEPGEDDDVVKLWAEAIAQRPDIRAMTIAVEASDLAISAAETGLLPSISAGAELGAQAQEFGGAPELGVGAGWGVSVTLRWPILDGGLTAAQVAEARAQRIVAEREVAAAALRVRGEVTAAKVAIENAKAELAAAAASRGIAEEALKLAEARYAQGLSSGIELADAQAQVVLSGADEVAAQWSLAGARTALRAAMGRGVEGGAP